MTAPWKFAIVALVLYGFLSAASLWLMENRLFVLESKMPVAGPTFTPMPHLSVVNPTVHKAAK